jgi:YggT family protein
VPIGPLLARVLNFYGLLIVAYTLMSWVAPSLGPGLGRDIYGVLGSLCEPFVGLFRRFLPAVMIGSAGIDFSPLVAFVVIQIAAGLVGRL